MKKALSDQPSAFRMTGAHKRQGLVSTICVLTVGLALACSHQSAGTGGATQNPATVQAASTSDKAAAAMPETGSPPRFNGARALQYTREVVAFGPRPVGSAAHTKLENYLRTQLKPYALEEDAFTASTPIGSKPMRNLIAKFPGAKDGIIVVAGHYDTKPIPGFVGANDGGSSTGLPLELAKELSAEMKSGKRAGYSVWVVLLDGEESIQQSNEMDFSNSMYGSQHLADKWQKDGTLKRIKAFLLVDMIGDADLDILRDSNSNASLQDLIYQAATRLGYQSHFFRAETAMEDDHIPFVQRGVPSADLIDFTYGYDNAFWHTREDTLDKLSATSFEIVGSVLLQTIRRLDQQ
jgi:hypothetical protein